MKREIMLDGVKINDDSDCYVIAEIGHNHQGDIEIAKEMIQVAKTNGANAVKLQKRDNKALFTKEIYNSSYDSESSYGNTYGAHREFLEFGYAEYQELVGYARELGVTLFATAFDFNSADFLAKLNMPIFKFSSGDLTNIPLMKHVAQFGRPMIVSTGGGTLDDVKRVYDTIMPINSQLCILQCTATYPIYNYEEMNLHVIRTYRETFPEIIIGLSDHESGIAMAVAAFILGARVVEKHFTLNRSWKGTDHSFSLGPSGLKRMCRNLHRTRLALGDGVKKRYPSEEKPLYKMGKKLVAARSLSEGHALKQKDVAIKSPGDGLPPYELSNIIGRILNRKLNEDENITFECLAG